MLYPEKELTNYIPAYEPLSLKEPVVKYHDIVLRCIQKWAKRRGDDDAAEGDDDDEYHDNVYFTHEVDDDIVDCDDYDISVR